MYSKRKYKVGSICIDTGIVINTATNLFGIACRNQKIARLLAIKTLPMKKTAIALIAILYSCLLAAQPNTQDDFMRSSGKIYVVVAVIVAVFIGIVIFLVYLDRRLTKLEHQIKEND